MNAIFNAFAHPHSYKYDEYLFDLNDVYEAIELRKDFKTNHMVEMNTCWDLNYNVYITDINGKHHLISNESNLTDKELRPAHNIYKMWRSGAFDNAFRNTRYTDRVQKLYKENLIPFYMKTTYKVSLFTLIHAQSLNLLGDLENYLILDNNDLYLHWERYHGEEYKECTLEELKKSMKNFIDDQFK